MRVRGAHISDDDFFLIILTDVSYSDRILELL